MIRRARFRYCQLTLVVRARGTLYRKLRTRSKGVVARAWSRWLVKIWPWR